MLSSHKIDIIIKVALNISFSFGCSMADELLKIFNQFNSQMQLFNKDAKDSWNEITNILKSASSEVGKRTIETMIAGTQITLYKTQINLDGTIANEFSSTQAADSDVYWKRHSELVNEVMATRKEIILKVIETAGITVKGIVNPLSSSNVDPVKLLELLQEKR